MKWNMEFRDPNGNKIDENEWVDVWSNHLAKAAAEATMEQITQHVSGMTCPEHGEKITLNFQLMNFPDNPQLGITATGCCDNFARSVLTSVGIIPANKPD